MERYLSKEKISTYRGNVLPLRLLGGEPYSKEKIRWTCSDESIVQITSFAKNTRNGGEFTDGVLLTFLEVGEAIVTAKFGKKEYVCNIEVREMKHAESSKDLRYFVGDMHDHTWNNHNQKVFCERGPELWPINNYMRQMKEDGRMDFAVVSDHACCLNAVEYYRGYADADDIGDDVIYFPGSESQVTIREKDRYGIEHMHGGEIVLLNANIYPDEYSWGDWFHRLKKSPFAFCIFPHPQGIGFSVPGIWDFYLSENNDQRFLDLFRLVETGNGSNRETNMINAYTYSVALDNGFHVAPTCASDEHGKHGWGYDVFPGKTVIMAPEKSKEAFFDAILHNRVYATSSGNVMLYYEVNGKTAPATLNDEGEYHFHVELSYFRMGEKDTRIKTCRVISDGGKTVLKLTDMGDDFTFTLNAPQAHWFYLELSDEQGRKTWSCPVWTDKPIEKKKSKKLSLLDKKGIRCTDEVSGEDASLVINDEPLNYWRSENTTASLLFDLGKEEKLSAFSHFPKWLTWAELKEENPLHATKGDLPTIRLKEYPSKFCLWASLDGNSFERVTDGVFRVFGGEETFRFKTTKAKYLRLEILETVGKAWEREEFSDAKIILGEISFWA